MSTAQRRFGQCQVDDVALRVTAAERIGDESRSGSKPYKPPPA